MDQIKTKLTTNAIGERAQGFIAAEVMKYGYTVLIPFGDDHRYNMVLEKNGQFLRLLCREGRYKNGAIIFSTCSVQWLTRMKRQYSREEIDYFAVYCEYTRKIYLVPPEDVAPTVGTLRVEPPANNQSKGVRWAEDYEMQVWMERQLSRE